MRLLEYEDLRRIEYVSDPQLSPDGKEALYVCTVHGEDGGHVSRVCLADLETGRETVLLPDGESCCSPAWSPDGTRISFLRGKEGERQIWLYEREGGRYTMLTRMRHGVSRYCWSPDGSRIAFCAEYWKEEEERGLEQTLMSAQEREAWEHERALAPVAVETLMYKLDEAHGLLDGRISHLGLADAEGGPARMLTRGEVPFSDPVWSPDGRFIACTGRPHRHVREMEPELYLYDCENGSMRQIAAPHFEGSRNAVFPGDADHFVYIGRDAEAEGFLEVPWMIALPEGGEAENLFRDVSGCSGVAPMVTGHTAYGEYPSPLQPDGRDGFYFLSAWQGDSQIFHWSRACGVRPVTQGRHCIHGFHRRNDLLLYGKGTALQIADLDLCRTDGGQERRVTHHNGWLSGIRLSEPEEQRTPGADGKTMIHGYVMKPAVYEEGKKYPAVLDIHGGPDCFYAYDFWFEFQMLAARGMAVVFCDPRGSAGYGPQFNAAGISWKQEAMDDLHAFLDAAVDRGFIDPDRIGCTGGSYGGYMTCRLIGRYPERYRAAVAQRALTNTGTSYGTGDMGFFYRGKDTAPILQELLNRVGTTPVSMADRIRTPLLLLHGEEDYRCTREQAEQMFIAMKDRNPEVPVKLVIFPKENHELTRSGNANAQIRHLYELCEWFCRYLDRKEEDADETAL